MHQREPARVTPEVRQRVLVPLGDPVEVELQLHQPGVGGLEQDVEGEPSLDVGELEVVVVVAELQTGLARCLPRAVEQRAEPPVLVQGLALLRREPGAGHVVLAQLGRRLQGPGPVFAHRADVHVPGGRRETQAVEQRAQRLDRAHGIAGELHLLVSNRGDLDQGALRVPSQVVADGVELDADGPQLSRPGRVSLAECRVPTAEGSAFQHAPPGQPLAE